MRWSEIITGDISDAQLDKAANLCGLGEPAESRPVDDVLIYASVEPIDGRGGILGSAGPCLIRTADSLTIYGVMRFDSADVAALEQGGTFQDVILHEMGHVLGIGTLWGRKGLLTFSGSDCQASNDPAFTGTNAKDEYATLGGSGNVPVENDGGRGTKCGHWDEQTFDNELMTGFLGGSTSGNPLSRMTAASLQDLGYQINRNAADSYSIPGCSPNCLRAHDHAGIDMFGREILLSPIGTVDSNGEVRLLNDR